MGEKFSKDRRIRRREDFLLASRRGHRRNSPHFTVVFLKTGKLPTRLGLTVSRKIGGATQRNRVKRLVREYFRRNLAFLPEKTDISVVAKKGAADLHYEQVCSELRGVFGNSCAENRCQKN